MFRKNGADGSGTTDPEAIADRLASLTLPELAAEVMAAAFGSGTSGDDTTVTVGGANIGAGPDPYTIADHLSPGKTPDALRQELARLVAEGLQVLEHAGLVRPQMHTASGSIDYACTRKGRAALSAGNVEALL